jgi:hypothetical protein
MSGRNSNSVGNERKLPPSSYIVEN